jgi:hypothetical protein
LNTAAASAFFVRCATDSPNSVQETASNQVGSEAVLNMNGLIRKFSVALVLAVGACDGGSTVLSSETQAPPVDSLAPPTDTGAPAPPLPPPDTSAPTQLPPDSAPPPAGPPVHTGIPFGPSVETKHASSMSLLPPSSLSPAFTALLDVAYIPTLLAKLEAARRTNGRVLLSFTGNEKYNRNSGGFSLPTWKQRVDRFRGIDLSSYIADGTLMGHFILDEPHDLTNWNGHLVSLADIEEMARYSKEIWPDLPAIIRAWPSELKGYQYKYLDAVWVQYHARFGSIDDFIVNNIRDAKASGLALVLGLNVVAGGGEDGIPGYFQDKHAMTASQVRAWGGALLAQPNVCAFLLFRYNPDYFARADIQAAMAELSAKAQSLPNQPCRRQ